MNDETPWGPHRAVLHVDLDAFYASVEQLRRPELRGRPVIVGGAGGSAPAALRRGVVSAASYEARRFGVHSAMPLATALRLCPTADVVPVDMETYRRASDGVFAILREYTPVIEPASLDEAYLDLTGSLRRFGQPGTVARTLVARVRDECGLDLSIGVATSKTVAKVASDLRKPRGLVVVRPGDEAAFLAPLPLRRLPGLGPSAERALNGLGLTLLGQLAALPEDVVRRRLGDAATSLVRRARGEDVTPVTVPGTPRSVSREETFGDDVIDAARLETRLRDLAADVGGRLRASSLRGRTVTLKLRRADFTTITRQRSLPHAVDADLAIAEAALRLLHESWDRTPVRLLGVGVSSLEDGADQLELVDPAAERQSRIDRALDGLRTRFGTGSVRRGALPASLRDLDVRGDDLRRAARGDGEEDAPATER